MVDLAVRVYKHKDELTFELRSYDVDLDDDGRARDFGESIIEDGVITGDGSKNGFDTKKVRHILSALEHAPDLEHLLQAFVSGTVTDGQRAHAARVLASVQAGELKYTPEGLR